MTETFPDVTNRQMAAEALLCWYKRWISPLFGNSCRFSPTCSEYAAQAVAEFGWWLGGCLALKRVLRCYPLSSSGYDPVPRCSRHLEPRA